MSQQKLELFFKETIKLKLTAKEIKKQIAEALLINATYQKRMDEYKTLRADLKMIKAGVEEGFGKEIEKLDDLKTALDEKKMMTTDLALSKLMAGETVEVTDDYGNVYEPVWSVKFKKTGSVK
jgi:hypothetical protein